jgi:hypothetical protein
MEDIMIIKNNFKFILLIIILCVLIIYIVNCNNNSTFSGSKTNNSNNFLVDFDIMNSTVKGNMLLLEGEIVETTVNIKKGNVNIIVSNENNTIAYQNTDVKSSNFLIKINETGTYTFYITGIKAKGSVYFVKSLNKEKAI